MLPSSLQKNNSIPLVRPIDPNNNDANNNQPLTLSKVPAESWLSTTSLPLNAYRIEAESKNAGPPHKPSEVAGPSRAARQVPTEELSSGCQTVEVDLRPKAKGARRMNHSLQPFLIQMGVPKGEMKDVWDPAVAIRRAKESKKKSWDDYRLDDFEIGKPLGEGRYGHVYLARTVNTHIIIALKVIHMKEIEKDRLENMVEREIEIHSRLRHPSIISMLGCFVDPVKEKIGMVLEFAPGGDLFSLLNAQTNKRFSHWKTAFYIKQVIEALIHLHSQNILHRDIKPENILIGYHGELKLSDFGWAIKRNNPNVRRLTVCGTVDYMAPEILMEQSYDDKADLWGLGTLSYELLTGNLPFPNRKPYRKGVRPTNLSSLELEFPGNVLHTAQHFISNLLQQVPSSRMSLNTARSHRWMHEATVATKKQLLPMFNNFDEVDIQGMDAAFQKIAMKASE